MPMQFADEANVLATENLRAMTASWLREISPATLINGTWHNMWRAIDEDGEILESFVTKKRDKAAALTFIKKALKHLGQPQKIITDGLQSDPAAMRKPGNLDRCEGGRAGSTTECRTATCCSAA